MAASPGVTVLGPLTVHRPYYYCAHCRHGRAALDQQLGLCAGSTSAGLDDRLALLGATEGSFEQAAAVLDQLTLVRVCPNLARMASERLGRVLHAAEQAAGAAAWAGQALPPPATPPPARLYVSMDGVLAHTYDGRKEYKLGALYTTITHVPHHRPDEPVLRAQAASFVGDFAEPQTFGRAPWCAAPARWWCPATGRTGAGPWRRSTSPRRGRSSPGTTPRGICGRWPLPSTARAPTRPSSGPRHAATGCGTARARPCGPPAGRTPPSASRSRRRSPIPPTTASGCATRYPE